MLNKTSASSSLLAVAHFVQQVERAAVVADERMHHRAQSLGLVIVRIVAAQGFALGDRFRLSAFLEFPLQRVHG